MHLPEFKTRKILYNLQHELKLIILKIIKKTVDLFMLMTRSLITIN